MEKMITHQELRGIVSYDESTGVMRWTEKRKGGAFVTGNEVGSVNRYGYRVTNIWKRAYMVHRLIWLYIHGAWPSENIDHINGIRSDNRLVNIRDVSQRVNCENKRHTLKNSKSGLMGAVWRPRSGKWVAHITVNRRQIYLGQFDSAVAAHQEYLSKKIAWHQGYVP
jgi:hypothetical protein